MKNYSFVLFLLSLTVEKYWYIKDKKVENIKKYIPDGTSLANDECPECHQHTLVMKEGCMVCSNCGYSKCGG